MFTLLLAAHAGSQPVSLLEPAATIPCRLRKQKSRKFNRKE